MSGNIIEGECEMSGTRAKQRSRKNKSYIVVNEGVKTKRPLPPGKMKKKSASEQEEISKQESVSESNKEEK